MSERKQPQHEAASTTSGTIEDAVRQEIVPLLPLSERNQPQHQAASTTSGTIEDAVRQVIVPSLKPSLINYLLQLVTRVAPHGIDEHDAKRLFDHVACTESLAFILADPAFQDIEEAKLEITKKLWEKLRPFVSGYTQDPMIQNDKEPEWTPPTNAPDSVKKVRSESLLPPTKPQPAPRRSMNFMYPGMVRPALQPVDSDDNKENNPNPPRNAQSAGFFPSGGPSYYRNQGSELRLDQKPRLPQSLQAVLATQQAPEPSVERNGSLLASFYTPRRSRH